MPARHPNQPTEENEPAARRRPEWLQNLIDLGPTIGQVSLLLGGVAAVITALAALLK